MDKFTWANVGRNVDFAKDANFVYLRVPADPKSRAAAPDSKSGKNKLLATTSGFASLGDTGVRVGINAIV